MIEICPTCKVVKDSCTCLRPVRIIPQIERQMFLQQIMMDSNSFKSGWITDNPIILAAQMNKHLGRLSEAVLKGAPPEEVEIHAANLHNFIMMMVDAYAHQVGVELAMDHTLQPSTDGILTYFPDGGSDGIIAGV